MQNTTDLSLQPKILILLIGQGHSDPFPIKTAKNIYDYCTKNVIIGFEASDLTEITNNY